MRSGKSTQRTLTWIAIAAAALGAVLAIIAWRGQWLRRSPIRTLYLTGAVLRQNPDPQKQSPIANAEITARGGLFEVRTKSDASGLFQLALRSGLRPFELITLRFEHHEYKPVEVTKAPQDQLYIVRMEPLTPDSDDQRPSGAEKALPIRDVRVRYTVKNQTTMTVGSLTKQFEVVNTGNVPCAGHRPCSPDGKWKATSQSLSLDAGAGNLFRNARVTCIAGPCPFTNIRPGDLSQPSRAIHLSVVNWSDTAPYLVEAEVTR
ncbi:MAG: carboxypeptidase regulatory-like domain-containing protein, partial [Acidobacteriota bacterium]